MNVKNTRQANLLGLLEQFKGKKAELARKLGKSPAQLHQWLEGIRRVSEETAREMERTAKLPAGWLDIDRDAPALQARVGTLLVAEATAPYSVDIGPLSTREVDALLALRALSTKQREAFVSQLMAAAEEANAFTAEVLSRQGAKTGTSDLGGDLPVRPDGLQPDTVPGKFR